MTCPAPREVHGPTHALDQLAGYRPVRQVTGRGDLHAAQNGRVDVAAADHGETDGGVEERRAGVDSHGLLAGVDEVGVDIVFVGIRADTEDPVLGVQHDVNTCRQEVRYQGW